MEIDSDPYTRWCKISIAKEIFDKILHEPYREPDWCCFGNWHWDVKLTKKQREKAMVILKDAYEKGQIRYACVNC